MGYLQDIAKKLNWSSAGDTGVSPVVGTSIDAKNSGVDPALYQRLKEKGVSSYDIVSQFKPRTTSSFIPSTLKSMTSSTAKIIGSIGKSILTKKGRAEIKKGLTAGTIGTASAIESTLAVGAKKLGMEQIADNLARTSQNDQNLLKAYSEMNFNINDTRKFSEKIKDPTFISQGIGQNLPNLLFAMGVALPAAVVGAPLAVIGGLAFGAAATLEGGFAYNDAKEFGVDEKTAEKVGTIVGVANGILETIPIGRLFTRSVVGKKLKRKLIREITKRTIQQVGLEGGTESIQEIVSNAVAQTYDENKKLFEGVKEAGFFGGLMGGGVSVATDLTTGLVGKPAGLSLKEVNDIESLKKRKLELEDIIEDKENADMVAVDESLELSDVRKKIRQIEGVVDTKKEVVETNISEINKIADNAIKDINITDKGSCMIATEKISNDLVNNGINNFKIVEGYIDLGNGKFNPEHTWIELKDGTVIDKTLEQFKGWDLSTVKYLDTKRKVYSPLEYDKLAKKYPTSLVEKFPKLVEAVKKEEEVEPTLTDDIAKAKAEDISSDELEKVDYLRTIIERNPLKKLDFDYLTGKLPQEKAKIFERKSQFGNKSNFLNALKANKEIMVTKHPAGEIEQIVFEGKPDDYLKKFYNTSIDELSGNKETKFKGGISDLQDKKIAKIKDEITDSDDMSLVFDEGPGALIEEEGYFPKLTTFKKTLKEQAKKKPAGTKMAQVVKEELPIDKKRKMIYNEEIQKAQAMGDTFEKFSKQFDKDDLILYNKIYGKGKNKLSELKRTSQREEVGRIVSEGENGLQRTSSETNLGELVKQIKNNPEGFTLSLDGKTISSGFAVSPYKGREVVLDKITSKEMEKFITKNADVLFSEGNYLGGWFNKDNGKFYLDVAVVKDNVDDAIEIAVNNKQIAIFDIGKSEEINTNKFLKDKLKQLWDEQAKKKPAGTKMAQVVKKAKEEKPKYAKLKEAVKEPIKKPVGTGVVRAIKEAKEAQLAEQKLLTTPYIAGDSFVTRPIDKQILSPESRIRREVRKYQEDVKKEKIISKFRLTAKEQRQNILAKIREKKDTVQEIKSDVIAYAKTYLKLHERGELLATVKNVNTYKGLDKAKSYINKLARASIKKFLIGKIEKELKSTRVRKPAGKPVGKFTPEVQNVLDGFVTSLKLGEEGATERISLNEQKISQMFVKDYDSKLNDELRLENKVLSMVSNLKGATITELNDTLGQIRKIKASGQLTADLKRFNRQSTKEIRVNKAIEEITGGKMLPEDLNTIGVRTLRPEELKERVKKFMGTLGKTFVGWPDIVNMLVRNVKVSKGETWLEKFAAVGKYDTIEKKGRRIYYEKVRKMRNDVFGFKNDGEMIKRSKEDALEIPLGIFKNTEGVYTELKLTKAEARKTWMEFKDPTLRESFTKGMYYTKEMVNVLDQFLDEKDKIFITKQLEFYREYYDTINKVYKEIYGVDLPFNEFYSPISREGMARDESVGFGEFLQEIAIRKSIAPNATKSRVKNIKPIKRRADVAVYQQHISQMEHFKAYALKMRDLREVFGDPRVRAAIIREHDKPMLAMVDHYLDYFTSSGSETSGNLQWLDKFRGNITRAVLSVKGSIGAKQISSFIAMADSIPIKDFVAGVVDFMTHPIKYSKILMQSEMMIARGENMERDVKTMTKTDEYSNQREHPSFLNSLMFNVKWGDHGAIFLGGWSVYRYHRRQGKSHEEALAIFDDIITNTQQSADPQAQSYWQQGGSSGGPVMKLFTMFQSAPNQFFRRMLGATRNLMHGKATPAEFAKTFVIYWILIPMLFQWISDFFQWDKDEQKRAIITGPMNGIFIFGDMYGAIIRYALGMKQFDSEIPIYSIKDDFGKAIKLIADDDITTEDVYNAIRGLAGTTGSLTGLPLKQSADITIGAKDMLMGEFEQGLAKALGWSPYTAEKRSKRQKLLEKYSK